MLAAVIFAHYFFILAEKYSYLVDWYIFGIPLHKRLASDGEYINFLENDNKMLENYYRKSNSASSTLNPTYSRNQVKKSNYNSSMGKYFISCKNCHHPVSNFMLNESSIKGVTQF